MIVKIGPGFMVSVGASKSLTVGRGMRYIVGSSKVGAGVVGAGNVDVLRDKLRALKVTVAPVKPRKQKYISF